MILTQRKIKMVSIQKAKELFFFFIQEQKDEENAKRISSGIRNEIFRKQKYSHNNRNMAVVDTYETEDWGVKEEIMNVKKELKVGIDFD